MTVHSESHACLIALVLAAGLWPAASARGEWVDPPTPSIQWEEPTPAGGVTAVRVADVPSALVDALGSASDTDPRWPSVCAVHLVSGDGSIPTGRPAMAGRYQIVAGRSLRFTPLFPLDTTRRYRATFDSDGPAGPARALVVDHAPTQVAPAGPTATVTRIEPTSDHPPANLLRFYIHFSAPMGRGDAYNHLQLLDSAGKTLDHPFLELGEELWDPTGTRLTVLLDPGRIKRGLKPHEEFGPIFNAGRTYTLQVDPSWHDAAGQPLAAAASKGFTTGPVDETSPDPKTWQITAPHAATTDPLTIRFGDTLDRATVASGLVLLNSQSEAVAGTAVADAPGTGWRLTPTVPWATGTYTLVINPDLEDLAGNSIRRLFEVDIQRDMPTSPEPPPPRLPILIR